MSKDTIHLFNNLSVKGLIANGQIGTPGQTLSSNGTVAYWSDTTGYTGSAGTNGYTGSQGVLGYHGSTGYAGSAGTNGYTGSAGTNGYTGSQGLLGYHGSTGFTGSAGTNGYTGSIGYTGSWGGTAQANVNMNNFSINSANVINAVDVNVSGNLVVSGATTTVNTTNLDVFDAIIRLNRGQATPLNDIGILMQRYATADSINYNVGFAWDETTDRLIFGTTPEDASDNDLSFASEWMTIAANGNVGIGTTSPINKLDIAGAGTINARIQNTANTQDASFTAQNTLGSALFGMNATGQYLYTAADVPLLFYNNGTEKMRIANTGSIAIGSTSPGDFGATTVTVDAFKSGGALFRARGTNVDAIMQASDVNSAMFIGTRGAHSVVLQANNTESMRLVANGNIGIGNTVPADKLLVQGTVLIGGDGVTSYGLKLQRLNSAIRAVQHDFAAPSNSPWILHGENLVWTGERAGTVESTQAYRPYYEAYAPAVNYKEFGFVNVTSGSFTTTNLIPNLVLASNGNVGIGTISPTVKMEVAGDILITSENIGLRTRFISGKASPANTAGPLYLQYNSNDFVQIGGGTGSANLNIASGTLIVANTSSGAGQITISTANSSANGGVGTEFLRSRIYSAQDMAMVTGQRLFFRGGGAAWGTSFSFSTDSPFNQVSGAGDHFVVTTIDARSNSSANGILSGVLSGYTLNTPVGASANLIAVSYRSNLNESSWTGTANNAMHIGAWYGSTLVYRVNKNGDIWTAGSLNVTTTSNFGNTTITGDLSVTGNTTLGDAATDRVTINANSITIAANVSIDAGTLFIDSVNNRVGIGTSTPSATLHTIGDDILFQGSGGSTLNVINGSGIRASSGLYLDTVTSTGGDIFLRPRTATAMFIAAATGNVGIGNSAPGALLHVNGDTRLASNSLGGNWVSFQRTGVNNWKMGTDGVGDVFTVAGNIVTFPQNVTIARQGLTVAPTTETLQAVDISQTWNNAAATFAALKLNITDTASNTNSLLMNLQTGGTSQFTVRKDGAVGVGTATPGAKLDVQQTTNTDVRFYSSGASSKTRAFIRAGTTNFSYETDDSNGSHYLFDNGSGTVASRYYLGAAGYWQFFTAGSEKLRIANTGNVGIGTNAPDRTLHVKSGGLVSTVLETTSTSSYLDIVDSGANYLRIGSFSGVTGISSSPTTYAHIAISASGNVGISNSAPTDKLSINGTTYLGGITTFAANVVLGSVGVSANGGFGTAGQVLHSNGTATYWAGDDGSVTNIATANGLSGGPITTTGTIGVTTGSTLIVNNSGIHVNPALSITSLALAGAITGATTVAAGNTTITGFANIVSGNVQLSSGYDIVSPDNFAIYDSTNTRDRFAFSTSNLYDTRSGGAHTFKIAGTNIANITGNTVLFTPTVGTLASTDDALEVFPTVLASSHEVRNFVRLVDTYNAGVNGQAFYIKSLSSGAHYGGWMMNATWGQSIRFGSAAGGADAANNIPTTYAEVGATSLSTTGLTFSTGNTTITGFANISTTVNAASFTIGSTTIANTSGITTTVGASAISFTNTTSNWITWNASGVGAPTATTRSAGTKLVVYPSIAAGSVDYGIGIESSHLWFSAASTGAGFKWYSNTTNIMTLNTTELNLNTRALGGVTTATVTSLNAGAGAVIANATVIRVSSNTNIIQDTTTGTGSISGVIGYNPEGSLGVHPFLTNDIANIRLRGATLGANTNVPLSNANFDAFFDSTPTYAQGFANNTANTVLEFVNIPTLLYGSKVGISFGATSWAPSTVIIEAFSEGAWVTCYSNTAFNQEQVVANIIGNGAVGTNALRFTMNASVATTRIAHIFAYDYNSDGWNQAAMPRSGGQFYGNVSVNSTSQFAIGTTVINSTAFTGTANNATYLNGQLASYYTNATNITTGTLPYAQIPANVVNTTAAFTRTGVTTFSANVIIGTSGFSANGTYGLAGEVLRSNGTSAYWGSAGGIGTVTSVGSGNGLTGGPIESSGTLSVVANTGIVANATGVFVNASYIATISANNASYLNGQPGSYYTNATNITTGTLPYAQIPANIVNTTAAFTISGIHTHTSPIIIRTTGSSQNGLEVSNSSVGIFLVANASSGVYNSLVASGDNLIYVSNNTINNGNLVIGSWTDRAGGFGIKLTTSTYNVNVVANTFTVGSAVSVVSNGNVGIGTASPTFRLQAETDTDANAGAFIRNSNTGTSATGTLTVASPVGNILMRAHSAAHSAWPNSTMIQSDSGFTGGLNIVQGGANPIKLWTNGTERMRIDSIGNVGVGVTPVAWGSTYRALEVRTSAVYDTPAGTASGFTFNAYFNGTNWLYKGTGGNATALRYEQSGAGHQWFVGPNGVGGATITFTNPMTLDINGNLGVGTATPGAKFHIAGGNMYITGSGTYAEPAIVAGVFAFDSVNGDLNISARSNGGNAFTRFFTSNAGTGGERMRITAAGDVGIGTTSPQQKFVVSDAGAGGIEIIPTGVIQSYNRSTSAYQALNIDAGVITFRIGVSEKMRLTGAGDVGIGTDTPGYKLHVNGSFAATTKSFVIDHPTKPDMKLRYGSLEGPENGVYVRGRLRAGETVILLPDYWEGLVDQDTYTVNLTPVGKHQELFVRYIADDYIVVGGEDIDCFYTVFAERKDVEKLEVEF